MPIYEYRCEACECCFEKLVFAGDEGAVCCPQCGRSNVKKQISCVSVFGSSGNSLCQSDSKGFS